MPKINPRPDSFFDERGVPERVMRKKSEGYTSMAKEQAYWDQIATSKRLQSENVRELNKHSWNY